MNQPNPEAATDRFQYNNGTRVIICLSKNYPMAKDVDVTGSDATFGRYIKNILMLNTNFLVTIF